MRLAHCIPMTVPLLPETARELLRRVALAQRDGRAPSLVAGVARSGELVWSQSRGSVEGSAPDTGTQYRIGSITKTFAAVMVMRLRDEGELDLADPLERFLPGLLPGISVGHLLSHTAGLATETPPPWWERVSGEVRPELADLLWPEPLRHPPGRRWHYSNPGFALAGAIAEKVRGAPWLDIVRAELLEPLGMTRTTAMPVAPHAKGWAVHPFADVAIAEPTPDTALMRPAGQLWSTVADLVTWGAVLAGERGDILAPATAAEMREPASGSPDGVSSYGLGLMLARTPRGSLHGHVGTMPGFLATLWVDQEQATSAVVLANVTYGPDVPGLAAALLEVVGTREPRIPEPWEPQPVDEDLLALTGLWYRGASAQILSVLPGRGLRLTPADQPGVHVDLAPRGEGWVVTTPGYYHGELLHLVRTPGGSPSHLDLGSVVITREPYQPAEAVSGGREDPGWQLPT